MLADLAGLVGGALSMAVGKYISVCLLRCAELPYLALSFGEALTRGLTCLTRAVAVTDVGVHRHSLLLMRCEMLWNGSGVSRQVEVAGLHSKPKSTDVGQTFDRGSSILLCIFVGEKGKDTAHARLRVVRLVVQHLTQTFSPCCFSR